MTRSKMAEFIRKVAADAYDNDEWSALMVTHYQDIPTEIARRETVGICLCYSNEPSDEKRQILLDIANGLEQFTDGNEFYFRSEAVGVLQELPPKKGEREIGYEPFRGSGHYELTSVLKEGQTAICEYMREGNRHTFIVLDCPSYGRLRIAAEPVSA